MIIEKTDENTSYGISLAWYTLGGAKFTQAVNEWVEGEGQ